MGERIGLWHQENLGPNEKIDIDDENGDPLLTIRRFKKGTIHITVRFNAKPFVFEKKVYIYLKKK